MMRLARLPVQRVKRWRLRTFLRMPSLQQFTRQPLSAMAPTPLTPTPLPIRNASGNINIC
jgi:hypothetical protein